MAMISFLFLQPEFINLCFWFIPPSLRGQDSSPEFWDKLGKVSPEFQIPTPSPHQNSPPNPKKSPKIKTKILPKWCFPLGGPSHQGKDDPEGLHDGGIPTPWIPGQLLPADYHQSCCHSPGPGLLPGRDPGIGMGSMSTPKNPYERPQNLAPLPEEEEQSLNFLPTSQNWK